MSAFQKIETHGEDSPPPTSLWWLVRVEEGSACPGQSPSPGPDPASALGTPTSILLLPSSGEALGRTRVLIPLAPWRAGVCGSLRAALQRHKMRSSAGTHVACENEGTGEPSGSEGKRLQAPSPQEKRLRGAFSKDLHGHPCIPGARKDGVDKSQVPHPQPPLGSVSPPVEGKYLVLPTRSSPRPPGR